MIAFAIAKSQLLALACLLWIVLVLPSVLCAVDCNTTEERKQIYLDTVFNDIGGATVFFKPCDCPEPPTTGTYQLPGFNPILLFPFAGLELPDATLPAIKCRITCDTNSNPDFELVSLVRVLFLTNNTDVQDDIIDFINESEANDLIRYWLEKGEKKNIYWSENHMILWMSSDYLLKQWRSQTIEGTNLKKLLLHFLSKKRFDCRLGLSK